MTEADFLKLLPAIERIAAFVARGRLKPQDVEDFTSLVKVRLIANDYAVLNKFEGRSRIETYLAVVIGQLLKDFLIAQFGKFHPSAAARRLGLVAMQLEQYLVKDGLPFDEACRRLRSHDGVTLSDVELEGLLKRLPRRYRRRMEDEAALVGMASHDRADRWIQEVEWRDRIDRMMAVFEATCATFSAEDALLTKLWFQDRLTMPEIARILGTVPKPLYGRVQDLRKRLKEALERAGFNAQDLLDDDD